MHRNILFTVLVAGLLLVGCSQSNKNKIDDRLTNPTASHLRIQHRNFDISRLQGAWWLNFNDGSALFFISGDSLYYVEDQSRPFFIQVQNDTLRMLRDRVGSIFQLKTLTEDSLIFYDPIMEEDIILMKKKK